MVTAMTMNYVDEAIGITNAAKSVGMPIVISFTVETDGRLPSGQSLKDAIENLDAATNHAPAYYMINCAHPTHFESQLLPANLGWEGYVASGPTHRPRAMRRSTTVRSSTKVMPWN